MKKSICRIQCLLSIFFLAQWSAEESSSGAYRKQKINFAGKLETHNKQYTVDNIAIGGLHKKIAVYELPDPGTTAEKVLTQNPKDGIVTFLDLAEISEITIPDDKTIWTFKDKEGSRGLQYIQVAVVSNDKEKTTNNYLIDLDRKITCNEINTAGPIEKSVPLTALKKLIITGHAPRDQASPAETKMYTSGVPEEPEAVALPEALPGLTPSIYPDTGPLLEPQSVES